MTYNVQLQPFPGQTIAVVRRQATLHQLGPVIQEACGTVWKAIQSQQIKGGRHVAVYLDNTYNLEVGAEVDPTFRPQGEVILSTLPAGNVATSTHSGPYQNLIAAHHAIQQWCKTNHHEPIRPCWEIYAHWQDQWNQNPTQIRTDVYYLLKS